MNLIQRSLLVTLLLLKIKSFTPDNWRNQQNFYLEPEQCNTNLLTLYTGLPKYETENRYPMNVSSQIRNKCKGVKSSCCLDSEFDKMTEITKTKLNKIEYGVRLLDIVLKKITNMKSTDIQNFVEKYLKKDQEANHSNLESNLYRSFRHIKKHYFSIKYRIKEVLKFIMNYSGNLNCSLCEARNHFAFPIKEEKFTFFINSNMCNRIFSSMKIQEFRHFVKDFRIISIINIALIKIYNVNYPLKNKQFKNFGIEMKEMTSECQNLDIKLIENTKCMNFCHTVAPFNQSIFEMFHTDHSVFVVLMGDYLGNRDLLPEIELSRTYSPLNGKLIKDIELESTNERAVRSVDRFSNKISVKYFIEPQDWNSSLNLNKMPIEYSEFLFNIRLTKFLNWDMQLEKGNLIKWTVGIILLILFQ